MKSKTIPISLFIAGFLIYSHLSNGWVDYDKSVTIRKLPSQQNTSIAPFEHKGFTITPKTTFQIEARLLSKKRYFWGNEAKLAPIDYALGWQAMSNYNVLKDLKITQSNRWYHYRYKQPPILKKEIIANSGNMHLIPANVDVKNKIKSARKGEIVKIKGYLVGVKSKNGWSWNSSLSRTDTGSGSCEVIWVEQIDII